MRFVGNFRVCPISRVCPLCKLKEGLSVDATFGCVKCAVRGTLTTAVYSGLFLSIGTLGGTKCYPFVCLVPSALIRRYSLLLGPGRANSSCLGDILVHGVS